MKTKKPNIIKACENYLGNRGISEPIKRAAYFNGLWFIVFECDPTEIEVSFVSWCYEPYQFYKAEGFKWTKANFAKIKNDLTAQN
jgi:hypothetical protein